ncbi:MAG: TonB-dependent receptor [Caulobacteraceae bacterium]
MKLMKRLAAGAAVTTLAMAMSTVAAYAQETTGKIRGVVEGGGVGVGGATITVTHVPSGTTATTVADEDGFFNVYGLRVGGPYTVTATSGGQSSTVTVRNVGLGDSSLISVPLSGGTGVSAVTITAAPNSSANYNNSVGFDSGDIASMPSVNRDLKDTVRVDPFVELDVANLKAMVVGGVSNRYNSITVDGVRQNDDFGLNNGTGTPTQRSPLSLEAVAAVSVNTAPFSVIYNDFLGANLNAVTKSGTNDFHFSIYGETIGVRKFNFDSDTNERTWGVTLGGPIWPNRAFFFVSYEKYDTTNPFPSGPVGSGRPLEITETTQAQVDTISTNLNTIYGFNYDVNNPLSSAGGLPAVDEKWFGRIDINITDAHRLALTYQNTYGDRQVEGIRASNTVTRLLPLRSHYYTLSDELTTYTAQLNSTWTPEISTEFAYSYKEVVRGQVPNAGCSTGPTATGDETCEFGQFTIYVTSNSTINAGPDSSRHANELTTKTTGWIGRLRWNLGDNALLFGVESQKLDVFNLFFQSTEAIYTFRPSTGTNGLPAGNTGLDNFLIRRPAQISYSNAIADANGDGFRNELDLAAAFAYTQTSAYVQDELRVNEDLDLLFGLRYVNYSTSDVPLANAFFNTRYGFTNALSIDGKSEWLPRFGFRWTFNDWRFSGGIGLFSGGQPNVWLSNNYSTSGVLGANVFCDLETAGHNTSTCPAAVADAVLGVAIPANAGFDVPPAIEALLDPSLPSIDNIRRAANTNAIDPDFKMPSSWKLSLSASTQAWDWNFGIDFLYTRVNQAITWIDLRGGLTPVGTAPDGRPIYRNRTQRAAFIGVSGSDGGSDLMITNTNEGWSRSFALSAYRSFDNGLDVRISHTWNRAMDVNGGLSTTASSSYGNNAVSDPVNPGLSTSTYEIRYSTKLTLTWTHEFFGDYKTIISLFGERRSGNPYSLVFRPVTSTGSTSNASVDQFGDVFGGRQLLYIPTVGDSRVTYENQLGSCTARPGGTPVDQILPSNFCQTASNTQQLLSEYIQANNLARGTIAERNSERSPYVTRFDLHLSQELPAFFPNGARLRAYIDLENIGNMLNKNWGVLEQVDFAYLAPVVDVRLVGGQYIYSNFRLPVMTTSNSDVPNRSNWLAKIGVSYSF